MTEVETNETEIEGSQSEIEPGPEVAVPPFVQIVTAMSRDEEGYPSEALYGLDGKGRVWEWIPGNPDYEGSRDGWELLPNETYREGVEPPAKRKPR